MTVTPTLIIAALLLAGCAHAPVDAPLAVEGKEPVVLVEKQVVVKKVPVEPMQCADGEPILSGYITDDDMAESDTTLGPVPPDLGSPDAYWAAHDQGVDAIEALTNKIETLQEHVKALLVAARRGRLCDR